MTQDTEGIHVEVKDHFFEKMDAQGIAVTFNDVGTVPRASLVPASEVDVATRFSRHVELKSPFVSAAMDTVTEYEMAIALAKLGGIGVLHSGLSAEEQKEQVRKVKFHLSGLIERPIAAKVGMRMCDVLELRDKHNDNFTTFPVVDEDARLKGILTQNDFDFCRDNTRQVTDVMTSEGIITAPERTTLEEADEIMHEHKKKVLPLIGDDGRLAGMYIFSDVDRIIRGDSRLFNVDQNNRLRVAAAVPTREDEAILRVEKMLPHLDVVVVDSATGDGVWARRTLAALKSQFSDLDVVVGNISNPDSARKLVDEGADGIKVGQGGGSICTTRQVTGAGMPQLTAIYNCAKAVRSEDVPVIADGGIVEPGDIAKAIAAGAHAVMMGRRYGGTIETPGLVIDLADGTKVKRIRGMGSESAVNNKLESRLRYGGDEETIPLPEGVEALIPYTGTSVTTVIRKDTQALRRGMEMVGAKDIDAMRKEVDFARRTDAGIIESRPHDIKQVSLSEYHSPDQL